MTRDKRYSDEHYIVNQILAEWNPIGVPEDIAESEYTSYVSNVLTFRNDLNGLIKELERIVSLVIGLNYDSNNSEHHQHTLTFAKKIIQALNDNKLISKRT